MPNPNPVGNRTANRGKKLRWDIRLTEEARIKLRRIWRARSLQEPGLTEDEIVNQAILALPEGGGEDWQGDVL